MPSADAGGKVVRRPRPGGRSRCPGPAGRRPCALPADADFRESRGWFVGERRAGHLQRQRRVAEDRPFCRCADAGQRRKNVRKCLHAFPAIGRFLRQGLEHDGIELRVEAGTFRGRAAGGGSGAICEINATVLLERHPAGEQFEEHHAEGIDVAGWSHRGRVAVDLLRRHVGR